MKNIIYLIIFFFSLSLPVYAKQKQTNWINVWTSDAGVVWYYDINSTKSMFFDNDFYGTAVKSYDKNKDETNYYTYCFECSPIAPLYWVKQYKKNRKVHWVGGQSSMPKTNDISGNLYIEICGKGKIKKTEDKLPFNIKVKPPMLFDYDVDINDFDY